MILKQKGNVRLEIYPRPGKSKYEVNRVVDEINLFNKLIPVVIIYISTSIKSLAESIYSQRKNEI
jgi:hypothetical protein